MSKSEAWHKAYLAHLAIALTLEAMWNRPHNRQYIIDHCLMRWGQEMSNAC